MQFVWFVIAGLFGGFLGGMGMGGGTLLIPILTLVLGVSQKSSQAINLISFLPMAILALLIHNKHHLTKFKEALFIILFGLVGAFVGSYFVKTVESDTLSIAFGIFLIVLGVFSIIKLLFFKKRQKNSEK
jgi:uncharacterized membrane protein YfcA